MQRYLIEQVVKTGEIIQVDKEIMHHQKRVMRYKNGQKVIIVDLDGNNYQSEIIDIDQGMIKIGSYQENDSELDVKVTLIYGLPKGSKFELVIQKATELGVSRIIPWQSKRSVVKLTKEKFNQKKVRLEKIIQEASEQAYRNTSVELTELVTTKEIINYLGDYNLVAYEEIAKEGKHFQLRETLNQLQPGQSLTVIVGCEGGIDKEEMDFFLDNNIKPCSLGKRILRSETAPLYLLSVIGYSREIR